MSAIMQVSLSLTAKHKIKCIIVHHHYYYYYYYNYIKAQKIFPLQPQK